MGQLDSSDDPVGRSLSSRDILTASYGGSLS